MLAYQLANAAMYGLEGRWLADPEGVDYLEEWKDMRRICSRRRSGMGIGDVRGRFVGERR